MASVDNEVLVSVDNHVCLITINRPERRNARTPEVNYRMMEACSRPIRTRRSS